MLEEAGSARLTEAMRRRLSANKLRKPMYIKHNKGHDLLDDRVYGELEKESKYHLMFNEHLLAVL